MITTLDVFADYNQIFLLDGDVRPPYPEDVTDDDIARRYKVVPHLIAIYTTNADYVAVTVVVSDAPLELEVDQWQHVVELPIQVPSGQLIVAGCADFLPDCPAIKMAPESYLARVYGRGFEPDGEEQYLVALWPSVAKAPRVLKQFSETANTQLDADAAPLST
jgi:hypothetical protein